ncbi:MAG: hypothetical protein G01um101419_812 [Parcubacteria group bacterium Gr01-1014_19]|nr:MAG: hypothetical protein G01um101419_812 [Parcubacteria group bacterium Gr01-1014_19]
MSKALIVLVALSVIGCNRAPLQGDRSANPQASFAVEPYNSFDSPVERNRKIYKLVIEGEGISLVESQNLLFAVRLLPKPMLEHLPVFEICRDSQHMKMEYRGKPWEAAGHCHTEGDGKICLHGSYPIRSDVVWHEMMHSFDYYLESKGQSRIEAWRKIAGDVYEEGQATDHLYGSFRADGLLDEYSRCNAWEDRATFFATCKRHITSVASSLLDGNDYLKRDPRYLAKLRELKNEGLFSEKEYQVLEPLFK